MRNIERKKNIEQALGTTIWNLSTELDHNTSFRELKVVSNWEKYDDTTILETINITDYLKGKIFIINDASYINNVIFETRDNDIEEFVRSYTSIYNYRGGVFDGDVYFISLDSMNLVHSHHNGIWFLYKLPLI